MKRFLLLFVVVLGIGGLIVWRLNQARAVAAEQTAIREARGKAPVPVAVAPVRRQDVTIEKEAVGTLEAALAVDIAPKVTGRIWFVQAREGDRVKAGQVLARMDSADLEAEVRLKEATVAQTRARLAEARSGQDPNEVTLQTEVRRGETALATARAQERQARADYDQKIAAAEAAVTDARARIAQADATIAQADAAIASAKANLENARTRLERQETLFKEGAVARQLVDDARTVAEVQQSAVGEAQQRREAALAAKASAEAQKQAAEKQVVVAENQAKATLDVARQAVTQAEATLKAAKANTARTSAYSSNIEALEAAVGAAQADLKVSQSRLTATTLISPLSGTVTRRYLDTGAVASPTTPILAVQASREIWVNIGIPEEDSRRLYRGQPATVRVDALPGKTFTGQIARIEPAADPRSRQFSVRITLPNDENRLRPGTFARVNLVTNRYEAVLTVPREAVREARKPGDSPGVMVATEGKAVERAIRTGPTDGQVVVVESGLSEGEQVVILTGRDLRDGQAIKVGGAEGGPTR